MARSSAASCLYVLLLHSIAHLVFVQGATIFVSDQNTRTVWTADPFEENDLFVGAAFSALPLQGIVTVWALDYDEVDEMIYWTDQGSAQISRSKLDGTEKMTIVSQPNAVYPRGIALDHDNNRIYWADAGTGKVESVTLTGSDRRTLATGLVEARDVELSVKHGIVFWCQDGTSGPLIERSDLDGANRTVIVQSDLIKPTGLAVNYEETRLYWCDYEKQTIESVEFDGSSRIVHVDRNTIAGYDIRPWRMALYGQDDEIFFTDNVNLILFGTDANGGFSAIPRTNFFQYPYDIAFVSNKSSDVTVQPPTSRTTVQPIPTTPHTTQTPIPDVVVDMMFVSDQNVRTVFKAEPSEKTETFVGVDFEALPLQGVLTPWAIEYDGMDDMIYWSDQGSAEIARSRLDGSNRTTIVIQPVVVYPRGIALDPASDRLFWADAGTGNVESTTLTGSDRRTLATGLFEARDIVVSNMHGFIFWCQDSTNGSIIERATKDGGNRTTIVREDLVKPTGLAINYDESRLYWCDYEAQTVESVNFDGSNRTVHIDRYTVEGFDIRPWRMALYGQDDDIFFTDNVNRVVLGPNEYGYYNPIPGKNFFQYPYDIAFALNSSIVEQSTPATPTSGSVHVTMANYLLVALLSALVISKLQNY